jgi:ABC-type bacteriocin/lantibiotic exporter with double-glycine peptidase domain
MSKQSVWYRPRNRFMLMKFQLKSVLHFLDFRTRYQLVFLGLLQVAFSILDLLAIFLVGLVTFVLLNSGVIPNLGTFSDLAIKVIAPNNSGVKEIVTRITVVIVILLVAKTALSIILTRKSFSLLSNRAADKSTNILWKLLNLPSSVLKRFEKQSVIFSVTEGVRSVYIEIIGSGLVLFSDISLLIMLFIGLAYVDFGLSVTSLIFFTGVGMVLFTSLHRKSRSYGEENSKLSIQTRKSLTYLLEGYKQIYASGRTNLYIDDFTQLRAKYAQVDANRSFIPYVGKYVIETAIILAGVLMGGLQFILNEPKVAIANLAIFLAATTRIAPAVLRVQQSLIQISGGLGASAPLIELIQQIQVNPPRVTFQNSDKGEENFIPSVSLNNVTFSYPDSLVESLSDVTASIVPGEFVLVVGGSGSGKTTLVDLILGLIQPTAGDVFISGMNPEAAIKRWPKNVSYLAQEHYLSEDTLYNNIVPIEFKDSNQDISSLINSVSLAEMVELFPTGLNHVIGDGGRLLSGGQRQRVGLARALFDKPKLLVLDEGTSALDWLTEREIIESINKLHGRVTVIMISHKVSQKFSADKVIYLNSGRIEYQGNFATFLKLYPGVITDEI